MKIRTAFKSLRHRNYRLFFIGQGISLIGTWMQLIALSWLVYRMTNSIFLLGFVGFASQIPTFILAPVAGVFADRCNRQRFIIITQFLAMVQAFILAGLVWTGNITISHIIFLSMFLGLVGAFDIPLRHSFVVEIIDKRNNLANAIALNSSLYNAARLIGPSIAGILIAVVGEGLCFFINAISYIGVLAMLSFIKVQPREIQKPYKRVFQELKEGFAYAFNFAPIRAILLVLALISLMGVPYQILMPVFVKDIFHKGPEALGYLMAASGAGALCGTIYLAARNSVVGLSKIIAVTSALFGIAIIILGASRDILFAMPVIFIAGFTMMVQMAACNTVLQSVVDEDKRGRIMSLYAMAFIGTMPLGSLLAGSLASKIGAPNTLLIGGIACITGALFFASKIPQLRKQIRPVYIKKQILPEVAKGIEAASGLKGLSE